MHIYPYLCIGHVQLAFGHHSLSCRDHITYGKLYPKHKNDAAIIYMSIYCQQGQYLELVFWKSRVKPQRNTLDPVGQEVVKSNF